MKDLSTYETYFKQFEDIFTRTYERGLTNTEFMMLIGAVNQICKLLDHYKEDYYKGMDFKKNALPLIEYTEHTSLSKPIYAFNEMKKRIENLNIFNLLYTDDRKSGNIISGDTIEYRESLFDNIKKSFDEYDEFYNNRTYYNQRYIGITDEDIKLGKALEIKGDFLYNIVVTKSGIFAKKYYTSLNHLQVDMRDYEVSIDTIMENISAAPSVSFDPLMGYLEKFYPEYLI